MKLRYRPFTLCRSAIAPLLRRLIKASDGIETIEFALVSITLFLFLLGVIEFGWLYWTQSELQYAAEAAARCATVNCCANGPAECGGTTGNAGVQNYTTNQLFGMSIPGSNLTNFQVNTNAICGNQVTFTYTYDFLVVGSLFPANSIVLSAKACHQA
jgi:Flp pilus assembly protein TadG